MTLRPEMARASHIFRSHSCNTRAGLQENSDVKADMAKRHEMYSRDLGRLREELASVTDARTSLEATHEGRMVMGRSSWCVRAAPGLVDAVTTAWPRPWLPRAGPPLPHGVRDSGVLSGPSGTCGAGWSRGDRLSSTPSDGTAP